MPPALSELWTAIKCLQTEVKQLRELNVKLFEVNQAIQAKLEKAKIRTASSLEWDLRKRIECLQKSNGKLRLNNATLKQQNKELTTALGAETLDL